MRERGPTLVVAACIVRGEEILLARRNQPDLPEAHLKWELPGGKVRFQESPHDALQREIQEELGTTVQIVRLLPQVQSNIYLRLDGRTVHSVVLGFECVLGRSSPAVLGISRGASDPWPAWAMRLHVQPFNRFWNVTQSHLKGAIP
jgi:ADP-ribose pyrophosphatase YjhB (NUDIX family)